MARVDYYGIENEIASILRADAGLSGVKISIEEDQEIGNESFIGIYLNRRITPEDQPLAAGTRTLIQIYFDIVCRTYAIDNIALAMQDRDDLLGKVEIILMGNRNLNGLVRFSWIAGGELISGKDSNNNGYISEGAIILVADKMAIT